MYGDSRWSRPSREIRLNVLEQVPSVRLLEARRTGSSAALAISGRIGGEVQQSGTVAPGQGRYESGLRDRSRRLRAVRDADFHHYVGIAFGGQLAVGPLHVRLLAEASVRRCAMSGRCSVSALLRWRARSRAGRKSIDFRTVSLDAEGRGLRQRVTGGEVAGFLTGFPCSVTALPIASGRMVVIAAGRDPTARLLELDELAELVFLAFPAGLAPPV